MKQENYKDADWLYAQYWTGKLPASKMAQKCGVDEQTIYNWMDRFGIRRRSFSEAFKGRKCHEKWKENVRITKNKQFPVEKYKYKDRDWLYDQYVTKKMSMTQIAEQYDFSHSIVSLWLKKFGIKTRKLIGLNHPNWTGGSPSYFSTIARKVWEEWHNTELPKGWAIHHMDYNRRNNEPWNLLGCTMSEHGKIENRGRIRLKKVKKNNQKSDQLSAQL